MYIHVLTYIYTYIIHTYIHTYIHTCTDVHTYIHHTYIHTSYIHTYIHTYIHAYCIGSINSQLYYFVKLCFWMPQYQQFTVFCVKSTSCSSKLELSMTTVAAVASLVSLHTSARQIGQSLQQRVLIIRGLQRNNIFILWTAN